METPPVMPGPEPQKKSNTPIIIGVVAALLLCCCCIALGLLWQFGDAIINSFSF